MALFASGIVAAVVNIVVEGCAPVVDWFARQRAAGAAECQRLADDADFQNASIANGDLGIATYGRYQPLHEPITTSGRKLR